MEQRKCRFAIEFKAKGLLFLVEVLVRPLRGLLPILLNFQPLSEGVE